jgi:subtilisin family serine protease
MEWADAGNRFFAKRTGSGVRVAIIDSGVYASHPHVAGVAGGVRICPDGTLTGEYVDRLGHGTAVTAAVREKAPGAELFAVQVFTDSLATSVETLTRAVDWAVDNRARLINLSLGSAMPEHEDALRLAVERARAANGIIVAARDDAGTRWLPGSLPGVVPVLLDWDCPRHEFRAGRSANGEVVFRASGYPRPIPGVAPERNLKGLSFAVANMTGFAARALEVHPDATIEHLVDLLAGAPP